MMSCETVTSAAIQLTSPQSQSHRTWLVHVSTWTTIIAWSTTRLCKARSIVPWGMQSILHAHASASLACDIAIVCDCVPLHTTATLRTEWNMYMTCNTHVMTYFNSEWRMINYIHVVTCSCTTHTIHLYVHQTSLCFNTIPSQCVHAMNIHVQYHACLDYTRLALTGACGCLVAPPMATPPAATFWPLLPLVAEAILVLLLPTEKTTLPANWDLSPPVIGGLR